MLIDDRSQEERSIEERPRQAAGLGVALGGGGMKGWAHVGVISELMRHSLHPDVLAGCSSGALIGAYWAAGYSLDEMRRFMREQKTSALFSFRFDGLGLLNTDALREYLRTHLHDCTFADLKVPFYVVCTDLETGKEVILSQGSVVEALLASVALPGIFAPVEIDGRLLVDGGLCNNVPVSPLVTHGARFTVAVRLQPELTGLTGVSLRKPPAAGEEKRVSLAMWTERLKQTFRPESSRLPNGFEVLGRSLEIVMAQIANYRLQAYRPDVLILPEVHHISALSFSEEKEDLFGAGLRAARAREKELAEIARRLG